VRTQERLPDDTAALHALVLTAWTERDAERDEKARLIEERDQLAGQNDRLRHLIRQLQRMQFGRRSEKLDPDQFNLALEDLEQADAAGEAEQEKADPALRKARSDKRRAGRGALPDHPGLRRGRLCREWRSSSSRKTPPARAAAARCM
jgi:transposase